MVKIMVGLVAMVGVILGASSGGIEMTVEKMMVKKVTVKKVTV